MRKFRFMAIAAITSVVLQMSCSAASVLINIPTVLSIDDYAHEQGRSVDDVLKNVRESAEEQMKAEQENKPETTPVAPVVTPVTPSVPNPYTDPSVSGVDVKVILVNGLPTIFLK